MANTRQNVVNPISAAIDVPGPVKKFGQDDGKFYRCYDALAEEIDEEMAKGLKEQLDGLLVFAGLFAGVNTAFLASTLPLMAADPTDDTNAILLQNNAILLDILQEEMKDVFVVNTLFALSLALALVSSFLAVLGRQWLIYYRKRGGGSAERQRLDQIDRFLGAEKWHLELILDDVLPSLLQVGLVLFCVSLVIYLRTVNSPLSWIIGSILGTALATVLIMSICAASDRFCPFQSPLSRLLSWYIFTFPPQVYRVLLRILVALVNLELVFVSQLLHWLDPSRPRLQLETLQAKFRWASQFLDARILRKPRVPFLLRQEGSEELHFTAIKRIIAISDDLSTLLHAIANIFAIQDPHLLAQLMTGGELRSCLLALRGDIYYGIMRSRSADCGELAVAGARLVDAALAHIILSISDDVEAEVAFLWLSHSVRDTSSIPPILPIETHLLPSSSPVLLEAHLAYIMTLRGLGLTSSDGLNAALLSYSEHLTSPSWRVMSLMAIAIADTTEDTNYPNSFARLFFTRSLDRHAVWRKKIRAAYLGDIENALLNIERAVLGPAGSRPMWPDNDVLALLFGGILKSANLAVFDKEKNPPVEVEQISVILQLTEHYILDQARTRTISDARRQLLIDMLKVFQEAGLRLVASKRFPISLVDRLILLFAGLEDSILKIPQNENEVQVLQSFGPLVHRLLVLKPSGGRDQLLRQAYDDFKLNIDRASELMMRRRRANRDPEVQWCHR